MEARSERPAEGSAGAFRPDPIDAWLSERGLGVARLLLAVSFLAVLHLRPTDAARPGGMADAILLAYAVFALTVVGLLTRTRVVRPQIAGTIHIFDLGCALALTTVVPDTRGIFFLFLFFPVLSAAYRWGFQEVLATTVATVGLLGMATVIFRHVAFDAMALPLLLVGMTGVVTGYLAEQARRARFEDRTLSIALGRARLGGKFGDTVNLVLASVREAFRASEALVVLNEKKSGRMLVWASKRTSGITDTPRPEQVPASEKSDYAFDVAGAAWHAAARWAGARRVFDAVVIDEAGERMPPVELRFSERFLRAHPCRRVIGVPADLDEDWSAVLLVIGPAVGVQREQCARFALKIARQIGPVLYDHYLARKLRTHAQSLERRRIARDLHDGVTQSLLGLEMEVVVLQRRAIAEAPQLVPDLTRVHGIVRDEVVTVRELMEGIRVGDVQSSDMIHHLTEVVDRFSRYTGIAARFVSDGKTPELSAYGRRQLARIVHEALVNVRKHSGADRVLVRADIDDGWWKISIEDDGRGFPFAGTKTMDELVAQHQGPRTILERIRLMGGDLAVESRPGFGSRLEVAIPVTRAAV